ncbi:MAG: hypothetical protein ACRD52_15425 [Candidatus Acidiferrales bacterium]
MIPSTPYFVSHIWLVPLFPLATGAAMFIFGRRLGKSTIAWLCSAGVGASFVFSVAAYFQLQALPPNQRPAAHNLFEWIPAVGYRTASGAPATFSAAWGFLLAPMSAAILLIVTGAALLIHIYLAGYLRKVDSHALVFGCMDLFVFAALFFALANNSLVFCAGWGALGLCGFLLLGLYFRKPATGEVGNNATDFDRVGGSLFPAGFRKLSVALGSFDSAVIDRAGVDGAGWLARGASRVCIWWDDWVVDGVIRLGAGIVRFLALPARLIQNGRVQSYILLFVIGLVGFLGYFAYQIHHAAR